MFMYITGLVSDVVPATQMSFASGIMGGLTAAGAVTGLLFLGWLGDQRLDLAYGVYAAAVLACTPFTFFAVEDKVRAHAHTPRTRTRRARQPSNLSSDLPT
jgi:Na+/H+ antiporter NhaD/arsenite permease-like protein